MLYIKSTPNKSGAYSAPQSNYVHGFLKMPENLLSDFLSYNGFVVLTVEDDVVISIAPNNEAWENWKESVPELSEEEKEAMPDAQADTDAMLIDHEYKLTLLELGVTE